MKCRADEGKIYVHYAHEVKSIGCWPWNEYIYGHIYSSHYIYIYIYIYTLVGFVLPSVFLNTSLCEPNLSFLFFVPPFFFYQAIGR